MVALGAHHQQPGARADAGGGVADVLEHLDRDPGRVTARAKVGEEIRHPPLRVGQPGLVAGLLESTTVAPPA
jgi:hypothetical protein